MRYFLLCLFICLFISGYSEGTKELMPDSSDATNCKILVANGNVGGNLRDPFALYNGDSSYRLFIHISDFTREKIYFGLGGITGGNVNWRIHNPDGTILWSGMTVSGGAGFITYYSQAYAGPNKLDPQGYPALSCQPHDNGDFFMTFQVPNFTSRTWQKFDITVIDTVSNAAKPGRVFSKAWQLNTYDPTAHGFYGKLYVYSIDGIITQFDANGFDGRWFTVSCNESGCYPIDANHNAQQARQSTMGWHNYPQYRIFLNDPDTIAYPSGVIGQLVPGSVTTETICYYGGINFIFETTSVGTVEVSLELSSLGPPYVDRLLIETVSGGIDTINWDGTDGNGLMVPNGATFLFTLTYTNGLTHLPLWDVETNVDGFKVKLTRPVTVPPTPDPAFYWDDSQVGGTVNILPPGCLSTPATGCHAWPIPPPTEWGDGKTINTWWYVANTSTAPVSIMYKVAPYPPAAIFGPASVCPGAVNQIYWIHEEMNSTSYTWNYTGTGATITSISDTMISVNFANNATSGNITVFGSNAECGDGLPQTYAVTVLPSPVVSLAPFTPVCINTAAFTLNGGTPPGGIYTLGGLPIVIFDPAAQGVGSFLITYTYTDPTTTCTAFDQKTLVVNPLPVVTLAPLAPVCITVPPFLLSGGSPVGGTYSGPGVSGGTTFSPSVAGAGTHNIIYTYTDANSCTSSDTMPITVFPMPVVALAPLAPVCVNLPPFPLTGGTPPGGTYSGPGVSGGIFDPAAAGPGTHPITYTYTDLNGCTSSDVKSITVLPLPGVPGAITGPATACQGATGQAYSVPPIADATSYTWTLAPAGSGTVTGSTNAITISWDPGFTGTVQIFVTGVNGCGSGAVSNPFNVTINPNPIVTLVRCMDSVTLITAQPFLLRGNIPPGGTFSGPGVNSLTGVFTPSVAGAGLKTIQYSYTNTWGCTRAATKTIRVLAPVAFICGSPLVDVRDGNSYPTVLLGGQCWMATNLNFGTAMLSPGHQRDNCIAEKYCYNDSPANCITDGGLYQWDEVMTYTSTAGAQGMCPPSWHVPTQGDWTQLFSLYINNGFAGAPLKYTGYSGFNALLSGVSHFNRAMNWPGFATMFWTSGSHGTYKAWAHGMNSYDPSVSLYPSFRNNAFSVRCLRD